MNLEVYIVAELDSGPKAYTTAAPGPRTFERQTFVFLDGLNSVSIPNRLVDALSNTVAAQTATFSFFDTLTPGETLRSSYRHQGCRVRAWVVNDAGIELLGFDGEVNEFKYDVQTGVTTIAAAATRSTIAIEFPPSNTLDDGRFVSRRTVNPAEYSIQNLEDYWTGMIDYLVPSMDFVSVIYGSPSNPPVDVEYLLPTIELTPTASVTLNDAYIFFDDDISDQAVPIIYGQNENVPSTLLGHYRIKDTSGAVEQYFKLFIYTVAGHSIIGDTLESTTSGFDFALKCYTESKVVGVQSGKTVSDGLNAPISYLVLPVEYTDSTFEKDSDDSGFAATRVYFKRLGGKVAAGGSLLTGLGNVLEDLWQTYGGGAGQYIDWTTVAASTPALNRFDVSMVFNSKQRDQTIERILNSRIQGQFPIAFGYPFGRLAWQSLELDDTAGVTGKIQYEVNAYSRGAITETKRSSIINEIRAQYGINGNTDSSDSSVSFDKDNLELCAASFARWGRMKSNTLTIQDTRSADTASRVALDKLKKSAGVRLSASYESDDLSLVTLPFLSVIHVTDAEAGFTDEPFYFLGIKWNSDITGFDVDLLSVGMI